jgi:septal ring factor EnvC (AmiA/AmiB activator)
MSFLRKNIYLIIIVGLIIFSYMIYHNNSNISKDKEIFQHKIDSLNQLIEIKNSEQVTLENQITKMKTEINYLNTNIYNMKQELNKSSKKYNEKINRVDKLSESELDSFFSSRYR